MTNEGVILSIILIVIILGILLLYKAGVFRRHVTVTIIENLPPWIFKKGRREEYSKNCELKSVKNENGELESMAEDEIEKNDSYEKSEDEADTGNESSSLVNEVSDYADDSHLKAENSIEADLNEQLKDNVVIDESFECQLEDSQAESSYESDDMGKSANLEVSNDVENKDSEEMKSPDHDENNCLDGKASDVQEHKPKFITNSLSMLKDYEKLLDKLNDDSVNESNDIITDEFNNMLENNSQSKDIEKSFTPQESCKVKQDEKEQLKCEEVVYWTTAGKTYHKKKTCTALARSKVIHKGTIAESGKLSLCSKCR